MDDFPFENDEENAFEDRNLNENEFYTSTHKNTNNYPDNDNNLLLRKKRRLEDASLLSELDMNQMEFAHSNQDLNHQKDRNFYSNSNATVQTTNCSKTTHHHDRRPFKYINSLLLNGKDIKLKMFESGPDISSDEMSWKNNECLLPKSISILKLEIAAEDEKKRKKVIEDMKCSDTFMEPPDKSNAEVNLWVEKFRPKDFFELLSDDGTNRLILTWIKTWDHVVFGKELEKDKPDNGAKSLSSNNKVDTPNNKKRKRMHNADAELEEKILELDELKRPKVKVALISGPPGLGKTTLAQIISKRAGYNCIEMNASDDRSPDSFKQYIESVTQTRGTVNDVNMKPNCLIIDEIDGAPQNSIQVLIDHINETAKSKKEVKRCLRPIICICNDLYAPALKQLRQCAIVFQCHQVSVHRLAERLKNICVQTNLQSDSDGLIALCDKTNSDIRSCLNTLQFLAKRTNRITAKLINELNIGQKDIEKNIFSIMNEIFLKKFDKKETGNGKSDEKSRSSTILTMCQNCDLDKLNQALFENFLFIRFRDNNFENVQKAEEWYLFSDKLSKLIKHNQDYFYMGYQRYVPLMFNTLFSPLSTQIHSQNKRFAYPHVLYDSEMKLSKNRKIASSFLSEMSPLARVFYNSASFMQIDLLPYLNQILQINIRPVAIKLLSKSEKEKFDNLINIMILFNLNYRQEKLVDGQFGFVLDPPIDELIKLNGMKQHKQMSYMIRQQIAREITITRVKNLEISKNSNGLSKPNVNTIQVQKAPAAQQQQKVDIQNKPKNLLSMMNQNNQSKSSIETAVKKNTEFREKTGIHNFFERIVINDKKKNNDEKEKPNEVKRKLNDGVYLKYKEGFTNAVRYNIKINQLL